MGDARLIKDVRNIKNALTKLSRLSPVQFKNRSSEAEFSAGFVAQNFFKVFPEFVIKSNDDGTSPLPPKDESKPGVQGWVIPRLEVLVPFIVAALGEIKTYVEDLEHAARQHIRRTDRRLDELETRVSTLENPPGTN